MLHSSYPQPTDVQPHEPIIGCTPIQIPLLERLNAKIRSLLQLAETLEKVDEKTSKVTRPLSWYLGGVYFKGTGSASLQTDDQNRVLNLNVDIAFQIQKYLPEEFTLYALLIFVCHESSHISQRLKTHEDVQYLKLANKTLGREKMAQLDLQSDFLAAHTLSLFFTLEQNYGNYNKKLYVRWLHKLWCEISRRMLYIFPANNRKDKQQRVFGYLLMSILIQNSYLSGYPLEFEEELWPVWSVKKDILTIFSNGYPFLPGCEVNPNLMNKILHNISNQDYSTALKDVEILWKQLPRR